eukprot:3361512-Prymnesium_polylepis.2
MLAVRNAIVCPARETLPPAAADEQNMICAVDMGFLSTSRNQQTPVDYMKGDQNVLWCLKPQPESDSAYHHGADISLLSQYAGEEEGATSHCDPRTPRAPRAAPHDAATAKAQP